MSDKKKKKQTKLHTMHRALVQNVLTRPKPKLNVKYFETNPDAQILIFNNLLILRNYLWQNNIRDRITDIHRHKIIAWNRNEHFFYGFNIQYVFLIISSNFVSRSSTLFLTFDPLTKNTMVFMTPSKCNQELGLIAKTSTAYDRHVNDLHKKYGVRYRCKEKITPVK